MNPESNIVHLLEGWGLESLIPVFTRKYWIYSYIKTWCRKQLYSWGIISTMHLLIDVKHGCHISFRYLLKTYETNHISFHYQLIHFFVLENEITMENVFNLDDKLIKELIPVIGQRLRFMEKMKEFSALNLPILVSWFMPTCLIVYLFYTSVKQ